MSAPSRGASIAGILAVLTILAALTWPLATRSASGALMIGAPRPMAPLPAEAATPHGAPDLARGTDPPTPYAPVRAAVDDWPAESETRREEPPVSPPRDLRLAVTLRTALGENPRAELARLDRHQAEALAVIATRERPPRVFESEGARPIKTSLGRFEHTHRGEKEEGGILHLEEPPPLYVCALLHHAVVAWQHVPAGAEHVELVLPAGALRDALATLRLSVVSAATGEPLAALVSVRTGDSSISGARAGADGKLTIEHLPPGVSMIETGAPGHATSVSRVSLQPGEDRTLEGLALEPVKLVRGELLGPRPLPPGIRLEYTLLGSAVDSTRATFPRPDGTCEFPADGEGRWLVRAVHDASAVDAAGCAPLGSRALEIETRGLLEPRFTLSLEAATRVVLPRRRGLADALRIRDSEGHALEGVRLGDVEQTVYLVPGAYDVGYTCGGSELEVRALLLGAAPVRLDPAP